AGRASRSPGGLTTRRSTSARCSSRRVSRATASRPCSGLPGRGKQERSPLVSDPIKRGTRPDGSPFYWFRISAGRHPVTGKRVQVYKSFATKREAKAEYAKIIRGLADKRFVARDGITITAYLDMWEPAHGRDLEEGSRAVISHDLRP